MASVKFRIKGSSNEVSIYMRFSISRESIFEVKTGFTIKPSSWSSATKMPIQNSPVNKSIFNDLKKLDLYVFKKFNLAQANGETVNKEWLEKVVLDCFEREEKVDTTYYTTDHIQFIIDNASTKKVAGKNKLGLSAARIQSYKTFKQNIIDFETFIKKKIKLTDITPALVEVYKNWLLKIKSFSINYAGKQLDNLRAVSRDAARLDIPTHPFASKIESFFEQDEDRHIVTLSPEELQKIKKADMPSPYLENAKKWLLLGCEIGQRGGDLLKLSSKNLRYVGDHMFVDVIQQKTKKEVTIPIGSKDLREMLETDFPRSISSQNLNTYIKTVCELSKINEVIEGKLLVKETNRKVVGHYPKYQLVTTHSFRRSFATNYYKKIATPILMAITGHSKESMFLKYINKREDKDENAKLFLQYYKQLN
jgi:integrase